MSFESVMLSNHLILCLPLLFQSLPASRSFSRSWLFASCGQKTGVSTSVSVLAMNIQCRVPLGLAGFLFKGLSRVFSSTTIWKPQFFGTQPFCGPTLRSVHDYWKSHSFDYLYLRQHSPVFAFKSTVLICHIFPSKKQAFSNFMAAVTICSDFGAQEASRLHNIEKRRGWEIKSRFQSQFRHLGIAWPLTNHCPPRNLFYHLHIANVIRFTEISPWTTLALSASNPISSENDICLILCVVTV